RRRPLRVLRPRLRLSPRRDDLGAVRGRRGERRPGGLSPRSEPRAGGYRDGVPNRLQDATSPYLLQHADNPVDWWEWGPDAFAEARRRNVPVLLSVGYAACHRCHVMGQESLE